MRITRTEHDARNRSGRVPATQCARLAPRPRPASLVATSPGSTIDGGAHQRPPKQRGRLGGDSEGRDSEDTKTVPERLRSAAARFRLKRSHGLVAEPMLYRRTANASRRRTVRPAAEGPFFHGPKRSAEPTASLRRAPSRATATARLFTSAAFERHLIVMRSLVVELQLA